MEDLSMMMKKIMVVGIVAIMMSFSFVACGNEEAGVSENLSEQVTEDWEIEAEVDDSTEDDLSEEMEDESSDVSTEFEIPVQESFVLVEGLSDNYADLDNRAFAYNGRVFKLGESTLKDLIDGGIPFNETELNNKGNNVNSNYETSRYTVEINDFVSMQFEFLNATEEPKTEEECPVSYVRYNYLYVPQPDYDAELNAEVTAAILDAANKVCFSFPATLTKEQLLENNGEFTEQDEYNNVDYYIESQVYMGNSGYHFEFNDTTNQLEEMSISWLP